MSIRYAYTGEGVRGFDRFAPTHAPDALRTLYRSMLRIRRIEEEIERRYQDDQMKTPIHLVIGQEATAVGCCAALLETDLVYSSHRTHGAYLAKGGDLKAMLCEMHCRANGCAGSRGGSMHLIDKRAGMAGTSAIVGGAVAVARARAGGGPTFIEAPVYRFRAHGGAGDDSRTGYRDEAERAAWEAFCPINMFGEYLTTARILDAQSVAAMEREIEAEI